MPTMVSFIVDFVPHHDDSETSDVPVNNFGRLFTYYFVRRYNYAVKFP